MTAEAIAKVVRDLETHRVLCSNADETLFKHSLEAAAIGPTIDATHLYQELVDMPAERDIIVARDYSRVAPPFPAFKVAWTTDKGTVNVLSATADEVIPRRKLWEVDIDPDWPEEEKVLHIVDWTRVRWEIITTYWVGGVAKGEPIPTHGAVFLTRLAVYEDGSVADQRWMDVVNHRVPPTYPIQDQWNMARLTQLAALNYLNCRNVQIVEPTRPRAESRRIQRTGVSIKTLQVHPVGKSTRSSPTAQGTGVPLTSVRGHFAEYGEQYGKGKLFGKYEGRFWVPAYARGDASIGVNANDYELKP